MLTFLVRWDSVTRLSTLFASYRPHMNSRKRFCDFFFDFAKIFYVVTTTGAGIFSLGSLGKGFFIFLNGWYWVWQKFNISRTALILGLSLHCADIKYFPGQRWYLVYLCIAQLLNIFPDSADTWFIAAKRRYLFDSSETLFIAGTADSCLKCPTFVPKSNMKETRQRLKPAALVW